MMRLSISTGTGEQGALFEGRARLMFLAGSQRAFLVMTIQGFMSVKQLAENGSHLKVDTKTL